ncbi:hypothetical protein NMY22_g10449 [Coprinellus aureogranulatus]|nr:hypothetical protein NMY22_g10449 [Coprinellus aureogranulatus]
MVCPPSRESSQNSVAAVANDKTGASCIVRGCQEKADATEDVKQVSEELAIDANPLNFSKRKKWTITFVACTFTLLASAATTSYTMGYASMSRDIGCSESQAVVGLSAYVIAYGVTPLFTSAFSEEFGRHPLYWVSVTVFLVMHVMIALAPNIIVVAIARVIQGAAGSTGATMVAGTLADIWDAKERGLPMALYSVLAFIGNGLGTLVAGWIEANEKLQWKWIQWISLILAGCYLVIFAFTMSETRAPILYAKAAKRLAKSQGTVLCKTAVHKQSLHQRLWISCTRPLELLFSEPIVFAISVWLAFAWGVFYCMIGSMAPVFKRIHHFSIGQVGTVNVAMVIAVLLGYLTTILQERLYQKDVQRRSVEARLHCCCVAGVFFPASILMFAWFCQPNIHWALLCFSLVVFYWSIFTIYLAVFNYLADCYTTYASSALAGQSLLRNVIGGVFPLFTLKVSDKLGFTWSNTIYGCIAILSVPIPFAVFFLGPRLRKRSRLCIHS